MPRKPKKQKEQVQIVVEGVVHSVTLFPPHGREKSWHVYWKGLPTRRSTRQRDYDSAVRAVERMLCNGGRIPDQQSQSMSDEEFVEIQLRYYERIKAKPETIKSCLEAISAFQDISGVSPISTATADDCARFQDEALKLPKNWRVRYGSEERRKKKLSDENVERLSDLTVLKWSTTLRAAFNRGNVNAGKKCVRNVVSPRKLLTSNPWDEFTWIESKKTVEVRQFDPNELVSILDFFEAKYPSMPIAQLTAQTFFWSCARRKEISSLKWSQLRIVGDEIHFDIVGKWNVRKWFRIPGRLYSELLEIRTESPFVFAAYPEQLRRHHEHSRRPKNAERIRSDFAPCNFGDWFYHGIVKWSEGQPDGSACVHVFRKTGLQSAVDGEAENRQVAEDACVTVQVMNTHYTPEQERQFRAKSNRMFNRIASSLPPEVLTRYGYTPKANDPLVIKLEQAYRNQDWAEAERLCGELRRRDQAG